MDYIFKLGAVRLKRNKETRNFTVLLKDGRVVCAGIVEDGQYKITRSHMPTPGRAGMIAGLLEAGADLSEMEAPEPESLPEPAPIPREERDTVPPPMRFTEFEPEECCDDPEGCDHGV